MKSLFCCQTHETGLWVKLGNIFFSLDSTWGVYWARHPKVREKMLVFIWFPRNRTSTYLILRTDSLMLLWEEGLEGVLVIVAATVRMSSVSIQFPIISFKAFWRRCHSGFKRSLWAFLLWEILPKFVSLCVERRAVHRELFCLPDFLLTNSPQNSKFV